MGQSAEPAGFPEEFGLAVEVLSTKVRVGVLLALRERGPLTLVQLEEQLGVGRALIRHHLLALEGLGILDVDPPRVETDVRKRYFSINDTALAVVARTVQSLVVNPRDRTP